MNIPLTERLRSTKLSDVVAQEKLTGKGYEKYSDKYYLSDDIK